MSDEYSVRACADRTAAGSSTTGSEAQATVPREKGTAYGSPWDGETCSRVDDKPGDGGIGSETE